MSGLKIDLFHFLQIAFLESFYLLVIYFGYIVVSLHTFGEGPNSFMYTTTNALIFLSLLIVPPTIFNVIKLLQHKIRGIRSKANNYHAIQALLTTAFVWFWRIFW